MFVCDRRGISCLNRQCERYHVARGGQLTLYGSGLSLLLRLYVTVPGGRERMCENERRPSRVRLYYVVRFIGS